MAKKKGPMQKAAERQQKNGLHHEEHEGHENGSIGETSKPAEKREVTEIKYKPKDKLVRIGYDEPHGKDTHNIILESKDMPKTDFVAALQALAPHAATICEMEDPDWIEGVVVLGVKMKPRRAGFGAVISCVKKLQSHAVMCFNTPFLPESAEHGPTLPSVVLQCLNTLMAEALAYVDGKRAQGELFQDTEANTR